MKNLFLFILFGMAVFTVSGQQVRFALQAGAAIPLGDFAQTNDNPADGGFAKTGFDMKFIGERIFESNFVVGMNLGFSMFSIDQDALKLYINPSNPELVIAESQAFQNINLQLRGGYNWVIKESGFHITPFIDAGMGVFNSAYYAIQFDGLTLLRTGNTGIALLISPGLDITYQVNDFVGLKLYGNYQFANYKVEEEFRIEEGSNLTLYSKTKTYHYSSTCIGIGANVIL